MEIPQLHFAIQPDPLYRGLRQNCMQHLQQVIKNLLLTYFFFIEDLKQFKYIYNILIILLLWVNV